MNNYLLLIGISCVPAVAGMCITLPLWRLRHLRNQTIHTLGLTVLFLTLASCLLPVITGENSGTGFAAIALSCINFFLFRHYERLLYTLRCPGLPWRILWYKHALDVCDMKIIHALGYSCQSV